MLDKKFRGPVSDEFGTTPPDDVDKPSSVVATTSVASFFASTRLSPPILPAVRRQPPEIWDAVFEHLADDRRSLAYAARTCRAFTLSAVRVLWRAPLASALLCVSGAERREMYGRAIRTLAIEEGPEPYQLDHWRFPAVHTLEYNFLQWPQRLSVLAVGNIGFPGLLAAQDLGK